MVKDGFTTNKQVTDAFENFIQALWSDTKLDHTIKSPAFHECQAICSKALADYWKNTTK